MKHIIIYIMPCALFLWIISMLSSCEIETHSKGNIDGNWHLEQIDSLNTGGINDLSNERIFWGVQANLVQLKDYYLPDSIYLMRFHMENDMFTLYEPHINDRDLHDPEVTDVSSLAHFGVNNLRESFQIEKLSANRLILKAEKLRLYFKKF